MPDITIICKSLKVLWVKRLLNDEPNQWKVMPIYFLKNVGGRFLFKCNYDIKTLNVKIPPMYKRIIQVWSELTQNTPQTANQLRNEFLWNNRFILISHKSVWWRNWHDQGLNRIENILTPDGAFVPYNDLAQKHIIDYWSYVSLQDPIPKDWKKNIKVYQNARTNNNSRTSEKRKNRHRRIISPY